MPALPQATCDSLKSVCTLQVRSQSAVHQLPRNHCRKSSELFPEMSILAHSELVICCHLCGLQIVDLCENGNWGPRWLNSACCEIHSQRSLDSQRLHRPPTLNSSSRNQRWTPDKLPWLKTKRPRVFIYLIFFFFNWRPHVPAKKSLAPGCGQGLSTNGWLGAFLCWQTRG